MTTPTPSLGRIVHYVSYGTPGGEYTSQRRAAIITAVDPADQRFVSLCVLNPEGIFFNPKVQYSEGGEPGTWSWPPRT